jgi:uncharacterized integral membrane protein
MPREADVDRMVWPYVIVGFLIFLVFLVIALWRFYSFT